jgi:hypothetical protein
MNIFPIISLDQISTDFEIQPIAMTVSQNLLRFDQDILWEKCSDLDFIKLFYSMSLLKITFEYCLHDA